MRDKTQPYDLNNYTPIQLRSNPYDLSSPIQKSKQSQPKCKQKKAEPKTYFCPYIGSQISGVAARNCNNLYDLETGQCKHQETCVAKEGLEEFAQSQPLYTTPVILARSQGRKLYETPKGTDWPV